ncbi:MAG: hypothetical protein BACD_00718 [Bacteroides rodentium]
MYLQMYTKIMRKINASLLSLIERSGKHPLLRGYVQGLCYITGVWKRNTNPLLSFKSFTASPA